MVTCGYPWKPRVKPLVPDGVTVQVLYRTREVSRHGPAAIRAMTSLTVLLYIGEEVLVVLGGRSPREEVLSDCHQLHLPTLSWSKVNQHHTEHWVH